MNDYEEVPVGNRIVDFEAIRKGLEKGTNCQKGKRKLNVAPFRLHN